MKVNSRKMAEKTLESALRGLSQLKTSLKDLEDAKKLIEKRKGDIIITGLGKSGAIAQKIAATLTSLGLRATFLHPVEAIHGDIGALSEGDVLLSLSFSGESREVIKLSAYAKKEFRVPIIAFTKSEKSALGELSDLVVRVPIEDEGSPSNLAPMSSTTATLVLGDMLASMLASELKTAHFAKLHPGGSLGLELGKVESLMKTGRLLPKVKEEAGAEEVFKEMTEKALGVTAVIDGKDRLAGVITDGDIRRWLLKSGNPSRDTAKKIMTKNPKTVLMGSNLKSALKLMETHRITTLFVIDRKEALKGVFHIHDIVEENLV